MPTSWKFTPVPGNPVKADLTSYPAVRDKITRLLIQYTLIESFFKFRRARQAYPFVLPQLLRPGSVVSSKEYGRHNSALMLLTDGILPEKTRKNFRSRESNAVRKTNIEAVAPHLPGLDTYHRTMPSVQDPDFPKLLRMLLPLDYALLVQNTGEAEKPDFNLTHFHVRIERLTDSALRDLGITLNYLEGGLYEKGEEFADLLEKKYFEYFNFYYNASGRKMAAANASQILAKLPFAATVFIASQEDRRLSLLTSQAHSNEVEIEQFILLRLDKSGLDALREHCQEHGLDLSSFLVMERPHFGVGILRVLYRHTEAGMPAADGQLRPRINPREKWVKVVEENLVPVHYDSGARIGCSLIYHPRFSALAVANSPEAMYLSGWLEGEEEMEEIDEEVSALGEVVDED